MGGISRRELLRGMGLAGLALGAAAGCSSSTGGARASAAQPLMPVTAWAAQFAKVTPSKQTFLDMSTSPDSKGYYDLGYGVDAYTMMFEATDDLAYLTQALTFVENVIGQAKPSSSLSSSSFQDDFQGWTSQASDTKGQEVPLYESYCWRYVVRFLRTVRDTPAVWSSQTWREHYGDVLEFSERNIFDKWYARGADDNIYRSRTHMASHWAFIALNLGALTEDQQRQARCREVVDAVDRQLPNYSSSLRGQLHVTSDNAYDWSDEWGRRSPSQDVSHGNGVLAWVVEAHDRGVEWTDDDIGTFVRTLDVAVLPSDGKPAEQVDGSGSGDGFLSDGFVKLGRYDAALQKKLESHDVRDAQFVAAMALNSRRLVAGGAH